MRALLMIPRRLIALVVMVVTGVVLIPVLVVAGRRGADWLFDQIEPIMRWAEL